MSENSKRLMITLKYYKGKEAYDKAGKLISESETLKLQYNSKSWHIYFNAVKGLGLSRIEVENCVDISAGDRKGVKIETPEEIVQIVKKSLSEPEKELTAEQKENKALKAKMDALEAQVAALLEAKQIPVTDEMVKSGTKNVPTPEQPITLTLEQQEEQVVLEKARSEYKKVFGKAPHPQMKLETMNTRVAEKLNTNK